MIRSLSQGRPFLVPMLCVGMPSSTLGVVFRLARRSHGGQHPKIRGAPRRDCQATPSVEDGIPTEDRGNEVWRRLDPQAGLMTSGNAQHQNLKGGGLEVELMARR